MSTLRVVAGQEQGTRGDIDAHPQRHSTIQAAPQKPSLITDQAVFIFIYSVDGHDESAAGECVAGVSPLQARWPRSQDLSVSSAKGRVGKHHHGGCGSTTDREQRDACHRRAPHTPRRRRTCCCFIRSAQLNPSSPTPSPQRQTDLAHHRHCSNWQQQQQQQQHRHRHRRPQTRQAAPAPGGAHPVAAACARHGGPHR